MFIGMSVFGYNTIQRIEVLNVQHLADTDAAFIRDLDLLDYYGPRLVDIIPAAKHSTVHINTGRWQGSGVVVSNNLVLTARHVIEGLPSDTVFTITFDNGVEMESNIAIAMDNYDVALIWIEESCVEPAGLSTASELILGQPIFVIGSPYGFENFNAVTSGIISGLDRNWDDYNPMTGGRYGWEVAFTGDASGGPGNSGGPLFTMDGRVRGILVGGYSSTTVCFMPVDLFLSNLEALEDMIYLEDGGKYDVDGWHFVEFSEDYYPKYRVY